MDPASELQCCLWWLSCAFPAATFSTQVWSYPQSTVLLTSFHPAFALPEVRAEIPNFSSMLRQNMSSRSVQHVRIVFESHQHRLVVPCFCICSPRLPHGMEFGISKLEQPHGAYLSSWLQTMLNPAMYRKLCSLISPGTLDRQQFNIVLFRSGFECGLGPSCIFFLPVKLYVLTDFW